MEELKKGDRGVTDLTPTLRLPKSDERVNALGDIDELISHLELIKSQYADRALGDILADLQVTLGRVSASVAAGDIGKNTLSGDDLGRIERYIEETDKSYSHEAEPVVNGKCILAVQLNLARAVARRAERSVCAVNKRSALHSNILKYMNRMSDVLLLLACRADSECGQTAQKSQPTAVKSENNAPTYEESIVKAVLAQLGVGRVLTLEKSKQFIDKITAYAASQGKQVVVAVVNSEGNPIAVEVMDGAFLVSFDVAMKKAYTAVAVKMPTIELAKLCQPGQTFFGLQSLDKMMTIGGGVPLYVGGALVGGLGVSGGTGEEDHSICEFALSEFAKLF